MRDALRLMLVWMLGLSVLGACSFRPAALPEDIVVGSWAASPQTGTVADGLDTASLSLTLVDPNMTPVPGATVCFAATDARVQLLAPTGAQAQTSSDANCALRAVTDAKGVVTALVAMLVDPGASEVLKADVTGFVMQNDKPVPLWAQGSVSFVAPVVQAGLRILGAPKSVTSGTPFTFAVGVYDGAGNVAPNYRGQVVFSSNDTRATLPKPYAFGASDVGMATFTTTLVSSGTQIVRVQDANHADYTAGSNISVLPADASLLRLALSPNVVVAGEEATLTVTVADSFGNAVTSLNADANITVTLDGNLTYSTVETFVDGVASVSLNANTDRIGLTDATKTHSLQVVDGDNGFVGTLDKIEVVAGPAIGMSLVMASSAMSYTQLVATLSVVDAFGNPATDYAGTIVLTSSDPQTAFAASPNGTAPLTASQPTPLSLPQSTYTFDANADRGVHTFGVTFKTIYPGNTVLVGTNTKATTHTLTLVDSANPNLVASQSINVGAAQNFLGVTLSPDGAQSQTTLSAGADCYLQVTEYNPAGVSQNILSPVSLRLQSLNDPNAVIAANPFSVATLPQLSAKNEFVFRTAGTQRTVVITDTATSYSGAVAVTVVPGNANQLIFSGVSPNSQAGLVQSFTLTVQDAYGNVVPSYAQSVSFSASSAVGVPPYQFVAADKGVHTFTNALQWTTAQSNAFLWVQDSNTPKAMGQASGLTITPGDPNKISLIVASTSGSSAASCTPLSVQAVLQDRFGNTATNVSQGNIVVTLQDAQGHLEPIIADGALSRVVTQGAATITPFKVAKAGTYAAQATWSNITSTQNITLNQATPTLTLPSGAASSPGSATIAYTTQGVCSGTVALTYTPSSGTGTLLMRQAAIAPAQGTDLHGVMQDAAARSFVWDSASDVGLSQSTGYLSAQLINPDTGAPLSQTSATYAINANNQGSFAATANGLPTNGNVSLASAYDVDRDGQLDVVFAAGHQMGVAFGSSAGQLGQTKVVGNPYDANSRVSQVAIADMDHDGVTEIVVCYTNDANRTGNVIMYAVSADSSRTIRTVATYGSTVYCHGLSLLDFDNDGYTDVVTTTATSASDTNEILFIQYTPGSLMDYGWGGTSLAAAALLGADINRDGAMDFVFTTPDSAAILIEWGDPNGNYPTSSTTISGPVRVAQLALADVNRDGYLDFVFMGPAGNANLYVYAGNANYFTTNNLILTAPPTINHTSPFVLADFNGDGIYDIGTSGAGGQPSRWFLGDGTGSFVVSNPQIYNSAQSSAVATGDFDHNGTQDIVSATGAALNTTLETAITRTNTDPKGVISVNPNIAARSMYVASGDLNNDGFEDLAVVANQANGGFTLQLLTGDSTGHFSPLLIEATASAEASYAGQPIVTDFNLDGFNDVVIPTETPSGSQVTYILGTATGVDTSPSPIGLSQTYLTQQLVVGDFDNDGWQDVALTSNAPAASGTAGGVAILSSAQTPSQPFPPTFKNRLPLNLTGTLGLAATNPNDTTGGAAGINLLVWGSSSTSVLLLNDRTAGFTPVTLSAMTNVTGAVVGNFNADSNADIAFVTAANTNAVMSMTGMGGGVFSTPVATSIPNCTATSLAQLPLPQLSGPSFAVGCSQTGGSRAIYNVTLATGLAQNGSATYLDIPTSGGATTQVLAADINGDGRKDLLTVNVGTASLSTPSMALAFSGPVTSSGGTFIGLKAQAAAEIAVSSAQVCLADIDGDGDLDAVVVNSATSRVTVYPGNRDGTFAMGASSTAVPGAVAIETGDLGRTGWPDVLVRGTSGITILTNTKGALSLTAGTSTSQSQVLSQDTNSILQVSLQDVNQDGYLDVVTLRKGGVVHVYPWQPASKTLGAGVPTTVGSGTTGFVFADVARQGPDNLITFGTPVQVWSRAGTSVSFGAASSPLASATSVAAADLNFDGYTDLIYTTSDNTLSVLLGGSNAAFAQAGQSASVALPATQSLSPTLKLVDMNRDGRLDAVLAWPGTALTMWIPGGANAAWAAPQTFAAGSTIGSMAIGDVNNDGRPDMVVSHAAGFWTPLSPATSADHVLSILAR